MHALAAPAALPLRPPALPSARAWHILAVLGAGQAGPVYRAELRSPGHFRRLVALKTLDPARADHSRRLALLRDEARLLGQVRHRAIVETLGVVRVAGRWALAMEHVAGAPLHALLDAGPIPPAAALQVAEEIASALDAAWNQAGPTGAPLRLRHRHISLDNVVLTPHGEIKLLDFGAARADMPGREAATVAAPSAGAPEQRWGTEGPGTDIYALGELLVALLTGTSIARAAPTPAAHADAVGRIEQAVLGRTGSLPLAALVRNMLNWHIDERPEASQIWRRCGDLARHIDGPSLRDWAEVAVPAHLPGVRLDDPLVGRIVTDRQFTATAPAPRENPWWVPLAVGGLVAIAGAGLLAAGLVAFALNLMGG